MDEAVDLERYRAPALDKGLDILELLANAEDGISQSEIARALDRTPNEIYRMLDRLVRRNYVRRTSADRYELTLKLFELAHARPPIQRLVGQALPVMRRFALQSEQACHLVIHDRNALVVVAQVDGPGYWNVSVRVGSRIGIVNTGSGHVFLAFATAEERNLLLEEQGAEGAISRELEVRFERVREQGYESMRSQQIPGVTNLSVPVVGPMGTVLAALTCPYTVRLDRPSSMGEVETLKLLQHSAGEISPRMGRGGDGERAGK